MLMRVLRSFPFSRDGIRSETADAGAVVDIPDGLVPGLRAEGFVEDPPSPEPAPPPAVEPKAPAEERGRRARKG